MKKLPICLLLAALAVNSGAKTLGDDAFDWYDVRELQFEGQAKWAATAKPHSSASTSAQQQTNA